MISSCIFNELGKVIKLKIPAEARMREKVANAPKYPSYV